MAQTFLSLRLCLPNHINQILEYTITHTHAQRIYPILICSTLIFHFRNLVWADVCVLTNQIASHFPRRLEVWRWGEVCARWRAATFKKKKKKEKPHSYFIYKTVISPFFLYFISDIRPSYAATIIFEELPMEGRNNNNNNNNRLDPWQIKTYCISHYPVKLSRELSRRAFIRQSIFFFFFFFE